MTTTTVPATELLPVPECTEPSVRDHVHPEGEPEGDLLLHIDEDHDAPSHAMTSLAFARGWHGEQDHN